MKIFFIQTASKIDYVVNNDKNILINLTFEQIVKKYSFFGFISLFGINDKMLFTGSDLDFFSNVTNSKFIQTKWANENSFKYSEENWQKEILAAQIEYFQPDVIYTGNHGLFTQELKKYLPKVKLYALWNASPMQEGIDLSYFDVGLTFNSIYHEHLQKRGIKNIEYNSFYIDSDIKNRLESMNLNQDIDIVFAGRYSPMFKDRNQFLYDVYEYFKKDYNVQYFLLTASRFKGLIPVLPWRLLSVYNKPVFLEDMFKVFNRSKIVLNTHSNITGSGKGNMRVYEALGSGSFMLSDDGIYPEYLVAGEDFVTYKDKKDMIDKIDYFLKHDKEREEVALNGYKKISQYYSTDIGSKNLKKIFERYL
ncbi:MAG: glycosyltransferase family 1 protein [Methylococcales bacterium]|nr:glycosyltransferase family 1 protein [Methylococcales bacterium]